MLLKRVVPLVAAAALFAGCSPMPSTAVQVGDTRISEAQVDGVVASCESVGIGPDQVDRRTLVMSEILGAVAVEIAADLDQTVTDEEALAVLRETAGESPALNDPECARIAAAGSKLQILVAKLGEDADIAVLQQMFEDVDVDLNPRYGQWDPAGEGVTGTGSMSVPS
ncbi:hypothetical protein H5398_00345 [Tessaracoccus sp. MC1679]|uniref:hypothetical protein n=1 Tax=unclassified Tessaracoccus TaxID=2635419 RepID=UPI0016048991|nr:MULTISPECIES: hypothetical protein [unclassified Tessaracoccus]MBB1511879.1 hypothetical protein [Tessaracoccus sp. MC1627]MBB1514434.1 hypothetical protein [Tessaracoccus sp. MC1679]